jgi:EAL domain-containing protein (putative c-di-GMP-specific phosphodiesterase class I)
MQTPSLAALTRGRGQVQRVIELAREHLGMDVVYLAQLTDGRQVYRKLAGDSASFGLTLDEGPLAETTYCQRMVAGEIPSLIPDTAVDPRVASLQTTLDGGIGAYIGVPVRLSDGTLYGTFCCLSHSPDHSLHDRDVRFMAMLAELIVDELGHERAHAQHRHDVAALLASEAVTMAVQPVVDLTDGRCLGFEALSRFPEPFARPDVAFALAREVGLGLELERLAVRSAWALLPQLRADQFLSVNLSPDVTLELAGSADDYPDLSLSQLVLEITEHAVIDSYEALRNALERLRGIGLRVAIDDVGAGYASLHHVVELQPDFIKIDRSLVHGVAVDRARRSTVSSFVLLALDLGATIIAEGVEQEEDLAALRDLGVDAAQGYLLARPSTVAADLTTWATSDVLLPPDRIPT